MSNRLPTYLTMAVNSRKPLKFRNRTNYFCPDSSRTEITVSSPKSFSFCSQKQEAYYNRLFWEFRYCQDHKGQTFYYTFTYNNKSMPKFEGRNCFDYNDLVYLLNGGLKKILLRKYGTSFKYFVGAELGEGSGTRGMHNNPHYHILFFLRSSDDPKRSYIKIKPEQFRSLLRKYWQGFDQDTDGWHSYKSAKYGIVKEGDFCGLVQDYRACLYVSKYVTKDVSLKKYEKYLINKLRSRSTFFCKNDSYTKTSFYYQVICPKLNFTSKPHCYLHDKDYRHNDWHFTPDSLIQHYLPVDYESFKSKVDYRLITPEDIIDNFLLSLGFSQEYSYFIDERIEEDFSRRLSEFRNRYSNKCRISQGVGDYALHHVINADNPRIPVVTNKGIVHRPLGLYYYRKLYTQVVKDPFGNPIRVLNQAGIDYKLSKYPQQEKKLFDSTLADLETVSSSLYEKMLNSDVNTDVHMSFERFEKGVLSNSNKQLIVKLYVQFKLVYEGRYFKIEDSGLDQDLIWPTLDPLRDLRRFLQPSYFFQPYDSVGLVNFLDSGAEGYLPFYSHPVFHQYIDFFCVFDLLTAYLFCETDKVFEDTVNEAKRVRKFHKQLELRSFYNNF